MIKKFSVKNFKAFDKKVTLDFSAIGNYEFNKECISNSVCKTAILYGKNAGGKSSICFALFDIVNVLTDNYYSQPSYRSYKHILHQDEDTEFEYEFKFDKDEVVYKYSKSDIDTLVSESLQINQKQIFTYNKKEVAKEIDINLDGAQTLKIASDKLDFSLCRFIKNNAILAENAENTVFKKFYDFVTKMLMFWSLESRSFIGFKVKPNENILNVIIENNNFEKLKKFFSDAGYEDKLSYKKNDSGEYNLFLQYEDKYIDFFVAASNGMKSMLLTYYWLENCLEKEKCPSLICIDEFDAFFHFELSAFIVKKLKNYNIQVLLTTHNTYNFTNDLLRPDCYYICSKDKIVNANNVTDKELRQGHNLEKLYRGGAFSS